MAAAELRKRVDAIDGRPPTAFLVPLTAVALLRSTRKQPELASPLMQLVGYVADALREEGEQASARLNLRERVAMDPSQMLSSDPEMRAAAVVGVGLPELWEGGQLGRPDRQFRARLRCGDGNYFATIGRARNGYHAAIGYFALVQDVISHEAYTTVVEPTARGLDALATTYFADLRENIPSFSATTALFVRVADAVRR